MSNQKRYYFNYIDSCNMCGSKSDTHKILGRRLNGSQGKNPSKKIGITTTIVKCTDCGLVYSNPQPVPFDIQDHYGVDPENYWRENYFAINEKYFLNEIAKLKTLIDFEPGMKSLDIGAGLGKQMIALANAGFDTYGFEPSEQFYERAISKMGIAEDHLKLGMMEEVEYPENTFDFISFGAVLEHLYDPSECIVKAMKWLKPGGIIHIEVPSSDWLVGRLFNFYYKLRMTDYVGNLSPMHEPYHLFEFTPKSFEAHAKQHNYELAAYQYYACPSQLPLPRFAEIRIRKYMQRTDTGMQLTVWLRKV